MKTIQDLFREMDQIYIEFSENIDEFVNKRKNYEINERRTKDGFR